MHVCRKTSAPAVVEIANFVVCQVSVVASQVGMDKIRDAAIELVGWDSNIEGV